MTEDARFEDGAERPLRIRALDEEDLRILSAVVQDAVFPVTEMRWDRRQRRFVALLNRYRWERRADIAGAERVQSLLSVEDVIGVATQGIDRTDRDVVLSLLSISFDPGEDGTGRILMTLAGDGAIGISVEALNVSVQDVTRPYTAPSGKAPSHPE